MFVAKKKSLEARMIVLYFHYYNVDKQKQNAGKQHKHFLLSGIGMLQQNKIWMFGLPFTFRRNAKDNKKIEQVEASDIKF